MEGHGSNSSEATSALTLHVALVLGGLVDELLLHSQNNLPNQGSVIQECHMFPWQGGTWEEFLPKPICNFSHPKANPASKCITTNNARFSVSCQAQFQWASFLQCQFSQTRNISTSFGIGTGCQSPSPSGPTPYSGRVGGHMSE